jgi:thiol-disulfide isomerase/thioredoxin
LLIAGLGVALALLAGPARAQAGFEVQAWPTNKAPPLSAGVDTQGKPLLLKGLRGQALVINFWATWCEPCREEMPSLAQLAQAHSGKLRVLAVNFKESPATVGQFVAATGLTIPTLRDPDGALARAWGIRVFPSTVLIGADGQVRSVVRGALDWQGEAASALIAPLLPAAPTPAAPKPAPAGQR